MEIHSTLNKYIEKKREYLGLIGMTILLKEADPKEIEKYKELANKAEMEMLSYARTFIEGFIVKR